MTIDDSKKTSVINSVLRAIEIESNAIIALKKRVGRDFEDACDIILNCRGRVVVTGMGKSGHIGRKIAATLASTGTPSMYVHPAEASHGDIGMITSADVVLALSNSGITEEITNLLPVLKRKKISLITITGDKNSALAAAASVNIDGQVEEEACPLGLTPTSSTTVALVLGDALAMALLEARGFTSDDFAFSHPGGNLGRKLFVKVKDVMHSGEEIPKVLATATLANALVEMSKKGFGLTTVFNEQNLLEGVFTDGDLRRMLSLDKDIRTTLVRDVMSTSYKSIYSNALAAEAANIMQTSNVYVLIVKNDDDKIEGISKMHDLLDANVV